MAIFVQRKHYKPISYMEGYVPYESPILHDINIF